MSASWPVDQYDQLRRQLREKYYRRQLGQLAYRTGTGIAALFGFAFGSARLGDEEIQILLAHLNPRVKL